MTVIDIHQTLQTGDLIQWYRVEKVLGRGGFGVTYLATDTNLDYRVAIKEYLPGPLVERLADNSLVANTDSAEYQYKGGLQRFLREARTLVKFRHPNIVRVMTVFEANNTAYLVMEYEEGDQFKEYVKSEGGISEARLKQLILSVIDGLDQVHKRGFIHRDIKPVNLIIRKDGSPVLLDFGSARPVEHDLKVQHTSFVSVGYTPLEQYQEGAGMVVGPWTDIYSLGATLYYAISGVTPVSPISRLAALVKKSKDPLLPAIQIGSADYSPSFLRAIDWALGFKIEDRPQSLSEWRQAFSSKSVPEEKPIVVNATEDQHQSSTMPANRSKLLVRNPDLARKPAPVPAGRFSGAPWLLAVFGLCASVLFAAVWIHRSQQQQVALDELIQQADSAFARADQITPAAGLYRKVLQSDPENRHAVDRLEQLADRRVKAIRVDIKNGNIAAAQLSIDQLETSDETSAAYLKVELQKRRDALEQDKKVNEVQELVNRQSYRAALNMIATYQGEGLQDARFAALESKAQSALDEERKRELQSAARQKELDQQRLANQRRVAEANERERQRRRDYRRYLASAERSLQSGDIESARRWVDTAAALQISDTELEDTEERVATAERFLQRPLSDYELSYARQQFSALERAIEAKNTRAINELTGADALRRSLFDTLFERYTQISVRIVDVEPWLDPKRATAVLRIEKMVLPNGDVVYPSSAYQDTTLTLLRNRYSWSSISW